MTDRPLRSLGERYGPGRDVWLKAGKQVSKGQRRRKLGRGCKSRLEADERQFCMVGT